MNERIAPQNPRGNSGQTLKNLGYLFITAGIIGTAIIENKLIKGDANSLADSLQNMEVSTETMTMVITGVILRLISCCAIPLFLFLLVEGVMHTKSFGRYFLRIAGLALVSEVPYDLVMHSTPFFFKDQNPVFGLVFGLIMIYFYRVYCKGKLKSALVYLFVTLFCCLWVLIFMVSDGVYMVLLTTTLWITRNYRRMQLYIGALVASFCVALFDFRAGNTIGSLVYLASPLSFLLIFRYNEEQGDGIRWINYAAYPVLLFSIWIVGKVIF